jgi:phosphoglycerol transferase MdoB-like AlkP superfamily enzyme
MTQVASAQPPRAGNRWNVAVVVLALLTVAKLLWLGGHVDLYGHPPHRAAVTGTLAVVAFCLAMMSAMASKRGHIPGAVALNSGATILALADIVHFRSLGDVISIAELSHAEQLPAVVPSILANLRSQDSLLFVDVLAGVALWVWVGRSAAGRDTPAPRRRVIATCAAITAGLLAIPPIRLIAHDPDQVFEYATTRRDIAVALGLLPYHLYDAFLHVSGPVFDRIRTTDGELQNAITTLASWPSVDATSSPLFGAARGRNVILVMAESLTMFPVDLDIDGQPVAPTLRALAEESLQFTNFFDQTHDGTTSDGEFTSLQGLHPWPVGAVATRYGANDFHGLPAVLTEHGYHTLSAIAEPGDFWNKRQMHAQLGFARSFFVEAYRPGEAFGMGLADGEFFAQTGPMLAVAPRPFMAFVVSLSSHHPYRLPAHHRGLRLGSLEGTLLGDYLQSVHYFDTALSQFLSQLRTHGLLDTSLLVVYGDHQAFWEEVPELPSLLGYEPTDKFHRWRTRERVPLLIRLPGQAVTRTVEQPGGHLDISPTVLSLLGVPADHEVFLGRDLTASRGDDPVVFRPGDFLAGRCACIQELATSASSACYDLATALPDQGCPYDAGRRVARERLKVSDDIIRGNLIEPLRAALASRRGEAMSTVH